jgi:phosphoglucosamine mutase
MLKRELFGTDGIRGKANIYPMTCEMAVALGRAVTSYFQKKSTKVPVIIIGKDTRLSCYMLEQAFSAGVCSQGGRGILTGPLPTPAVAFVTKSMRAQAGVMISASHNEYGDNGIKIFDHNGHKLSDSIESQLEKIVLNPEGLSVKLGADLGSTKRLDEVIGRYIVHAKNTFDECIGLENLRIVVDCAHGASYKVAPMIFQELGAEVIAIGNSPNGKNINDGFGAMHPGACAQKVLETRADCGICLDGDGDRLVVVDKNGHVIEGDKILGLLARLLLDRGLLSQLKSESSQPPSPSSFVVGTILNNLGLEIYLKKLGLGFVRTNVGDRYITEEMLKNGQLLGGEPSGHIIMRNYSTTGDGIIAALKVLEAMKFYGASLEELTREIILLPQFEKNIAVGHKPPLKNLTKLNETQDRVVRELGEKGRVVMRYSGTEPKVRVMVEGEDEELIKKLGQQLTDVLVKEIGKSV